MCRFQYLARRVERLSMGRVPVRQFGADSVGQVFAVVNVEKESGYRRAYRRALRSHLSLCNVALLLCDAVSLGHFQNMKRN